MAALILAGLLARNTTASPDDLERDAADAAEKLIKALDTSSDLKRSFSGKRNSELGYRQ
jgi:hypothetical protein